MRCRLAAVLVLLVCTGFAYPADGAAVAGQASSFVDVPTDHLF